MSNILLFHSDSIIAQGLKIYLSGIIEHQINIADSYSECLDSANFLNQLEEKFVVVAEGKSLDSDKCAQLAQLEQARLILCDRGAYPSGNRPNCQNSLILALNCNSSYISLEHNDPKNLILAIQCAFVGSVFICPEAKKKLNRCVFKSKLKQRQAVAQLGAIDRQILALAAQGHTHSRIGDIVNYSSLNISYRLRNIVRQLNLQTKQEAIALATSIGLTHHFDSDRDNLSDLQTA